jgi:hypothetical protein
LTLSVLDYISISESAQTKLIKAVPASDYINIDFASYSRSYSPLLFTMLARRVPIRYLTLSASDRVVVSDLASLVEIKVLSVLDVVVAADRTDVKSVAVRAYDYELMYDFAYAVGVKTIHAYDYITYDYVPHMSPDDIRYRSLYANVGMRTTSVFDNIVPYESVWAGPKAVVVHAYDYLISDSATAVKRSMHAYDIIIHDNANIAMTT